MKMKTTLTGSLYALATLACATTGLGLAGAPRLNSVTQKTSSTEGIVYMKNNLKVGDRIEFYDRRCSGRLEPCEVTRHGKGVVTAQNSPQYFAVKADEGAFFEEGTRVRKVKK